MTSRNDAILEGITFDELITTLQTNEAIIDETTIINVYNEIRRKQQKDAMYMLMNNIEFILKECQR